MGTISRGFLTNFILPPKIVQSTTVDTNGSVNQVGTLLYTDTSFKNKTDTNETKINNIKAILRHTNIYKKLKKLLLSLMILENNDRKKIRDFNIAIYTNLSSNETKTNNQYNDHNNLIILKSMLDDSFSKIKNKLGYSIVTYSEIKEDLILDGSKRYFNFPSKKQIILYGYEDIALFGNDITKDYTSSSDINWGETENIVQAAGEANNTNFTFVDDGTSTNTPGRYFSENTLGPLGPQADFLMSLINSPFKHTIYMSPKMEPLNTRTTQMFYIMETNPIGLVCGALSQRNFLQIKTETTDTTEGSTTTHTFNVNEEKLSQSMIAYETNIMGLNKDNKYVLPFLEIFKQNYTMVVKRWDNILKYARENNDIYFGNLKQTERGDKQKYSDMIKDIESGATFKQKILKEFFDANKSNLARLYFSTSDTDTNSGFINLKGVRTGNNDNKELSNNLTSLLTKIASPEAKDMKTSNASPNTWCDLEARGYQLDFSLKIYSRINSDTLDKFTDCKYPECEDKFGNFLFNALYKNKKTEGLIDESIFDIGLWDDDFTGIAEYDGHNFNSESSKCLVYELPFYLKLDENLFKYSTLLHNKLLNSKVKLDSAGWKLSKSFYLVKQDESTITVNGNEIVVPEVNLKGTGKKIEENFDENADPEAKKEKFTGKKTEVKELPTQPNENAEEVEEQVEGETNEVLDQKDMATDTELAEGNGNTNTDATTAEVVDVKGGGKIKRAADRSQAAAVIEAGFAVTGGKRPRKLHKGKIKKKGKGAGGNRGKLKKRIKRIVQKAVEKLIDEQNS